MSLRSCRAQLLGLFTIALQLPPVPAQAQQFDCTLTELSCTTNCAQTQVSFFIDTSQFARPQNPNDPLRRQVTLVSLNDIRLSASAIMMGGGIRGFHEDAGTLGSRMMIVQNDKSSRLVQQPHNTMLTGQCTRS